MSEVITRWRGLCQECAYVADDLSINKNPESRGMTVPHKNVLKHMLAHAKGILDPNGTDERAQCPLCQKVIECSAKQRSCGKGAQQKLRFHYVTEHPQEAEKWFESQGLRPPKMEELTFTADTWINMTHELKKGETPKRKRQGERAKRKRRGGRRRGKVTVPAGAVTVGELDVGVSGTDQRQEEANMADPVNSAADAGNRGGEPTGRDAQPVGDLPMGLPDPHGNPPSGEFENQSLIGYLRGGRIARARDDEEDAAWPSSTERMENRSASVRARSWSRTQNDEDYDEVEEGVRGKRREGDGIGRGGKIAIVAVLGLAAAGLGVLLWSRMRGKTSPELVPVGDVFTGSQGGESATVSPSAPVARSAALQPATSSPNKTDALKSGKNSARRQGVVFVEGHGHIGAQYADKVHRFL